MSSQLLRILILEDIAQDAELEERVLRQAGIAFTSQRAVTEDAFRKELETFLPHLILSDYSLPSFDGLKALTIAQQKSPDVPFIFVTGVMGEESAIETLKKGATDYVLKQNLSRLVPVVQRALKEAELKLAHNRFDKLLQESEHRFRLLYEKAPLPYQSLNESGCLIEVNAAWLKTLGYSREEVLGRWFGDLLSPASVESFRTTFARFKSLGEVHGVEFEMVRKDGAPVMVTFDGQVGLDNFGNFQQTHCIFADITDRRRAEEAIKKRIMALTSPLDDVKDVTFEELFNIDHIQRLQDEFSSATGVASIITRPDGTPITAPSNFCRLCKDIIRKTDKGRANCFRSDAEIGRLSADGPTIRPCTSGGLWDAGAGISVGEQHIANWLIGQVRDSTQDEERMRAYAEEIGANEAATLGAFREVPAMSLERFQTIAQVLFTLANQMSAAAFQNLQQARYITDRKRAEEALRKSEAELHDNYFSQAAINMILSESLGETVLEEILQKALNMLLSIPWIAFQPIGSIFLVEDEPEVLVMKAESNLSVELKRICARIPFGKCLCGRAAKRQQIEFADHVDEGHEITHEGMQPHSHYCVPILSGGKTLGILNLYLKESHVRDEKEEDFLRSVADTLAGIIMRKKAEERIAYYAYYDRLTGLPNRNLFLDRLKQGVARAEAGAKVVAVLIMDIDRFKGINDTYGTEVGDTVLQETGERLAAAVRRGDTVARLGNDEFGIALLDMADTEDVIPAMEKIMSYIGHPLQVGGTEITLTFSTGIATYPQDNRNPQDLVKSAGLALEKAKREGRRIYQFYTEDLNVKASEFLSMESSLYNAIRNNEFLLHYQPYWDMTTEKMVGMEALLRWQSRDMGLVSPGKFIPVLEDTGMIIEVGEWILREAMRQVKEWQEKGYPVVPVSVNMSLIQFRQQNVAEMVERLIRESGYYPSLLALEITESAFIQDIGFTGSVLRQLKELGCAVSIDDFGTGYSSLSYLKRFPVDNLKIDISFIREMVEDPDSASIVMAIINMAHTLNLKTIAEGIETDEQWKVLRLLRCDMGQGFHLSKPLPPKNIEQWFLSHPLPGDEKIS